MFECEIVTPEKSLYKAPVTFVALPGIVGEMGVLDGHVPLLTGLSTGKVRVTLESGDEQCFAVHGGYAQIQSDGKVIVLADKAVDVTAIDGEAAQARVAELEAQLAELDEEAAERAYLVSELEWEKLLVALA